MTRRPCTVRSITALTCGIILAVALAYPQRSHALPDFLVSGAFSPARLTAGGTATLTLTVSYPTVPIDSVTVAAAPAGATLVSQSTSCGIAVLESLRAERSSLTCSHTLVWRFDDAGSFNADDFDLVYSSAGSEVSPDVSGLDLAVGVASAAIPAPTPAPTACALAPDLAVSPQYIPIAPGGRATVLVTMRNRCDDQFSRRGDLLISFSDGLWVVAGGSVPESLVAIGQPESGSVPESLVAIGQPESGSIPESLVAIGQQFVVPGFDLDPGETRSWFVTVAAEDPLRAAPEHITEHYVGGRVQQRIDGIFLFAEGTTASTAAVAAAPAPTTGEAVPLPAVLPNTAAGNTLMMPLLLVLSTLALAAGGIRRLRSAGR